MFFKKGLCFECQRCLYCCSSEPGYVFLSAIDIENGANAIGISENEFVGIYCRYVDFGTYSMISLKEKSNYDCIFLTKQGCMIYSGRPVQCRTYPFWKGIVDSESSWKKESKSCPGINKGNLVPYSDILANLDENDKNIPVIIFKGKMSPYENNSQNPKLTI